MLGVRVLPGEPLRCSRHVWHDLDEGELLDVVRQRGTSRDPGGGTHERDPLGVRLFLDGLDDLDGREVLLSDLDGRRVDGDARPAVVEGVPVPGDAGVAPGVADDPPADPPADG